MDDVVDLRVQGLRDLLDLAVWDGASDWQGEESVVGLEVHVVKDALVVLLGHALLAREQEFGLSHDGCPGSRSGNSQRIQADRAGKVKDVGRERSDRDVVLYSCTGSHMEPSQQESVG